MKDKILNLDGITKEFSFQLEGRESDRYFCSCGENFISNHTEEIIELENVLNDGEDDYMGGVYKDIKLAIDREIKCPSCDKNFNDPDEARKLVPIGRYFISGFEFIETETDLIVYYAKSAPGVAERKNGDKLEHKIVFDEAIRYIRFEKESKKLAYQEFGDVDEVEFDLDEVIKYVDAFFKADTDKILNFFSLHMYINRLANFVSDTNNTSIVSEFLDHIRNAPNTVGVSYIKKLLSIFFGIIKYSNLSTVALTKGSQFLYDLMLECDIPTSKEMEDSGATSPVKIFNFLVTKYINKLNEEVNEDNKDSIDFFYKSKQRLSFEEDQLQGGEKINIEDEDVEASYKIRENKNYKGGKVVQTEGGFKVLDAVEDGTISKFIYNAITKFSEYKQLIKYFKFYDKSEVITLLQKYDLDLLTHSINVIYFRDKMEIKELDRILMIIDSFLKTRFMYKDYRNIDSFSFVEYDDARLMMEIMEFDPKRHFNKIKTYDELVEYHDLLVKYYKVKSEEERSGAIKDFVSKFTFLETRGPGDYEGPIHIKLHDSPGLIIKEGVEMRHSASAYAPKVAQGIYLLGSVYDKDPERPEDEQERFTIGFTYSKLQGIEFDQVKGFANRLGTDRFKKHMMDFLTAKDVSFRPIKDLKLKDEI